MANIKTKTILRLEAMLSNSGHMHIDENNLPTDAYFTEGVLFKESDPQKDLAMRKEGERFGIYVTHNSYRYNNKRNARHVMYDCYLVGVEVQLGEHIYVDKAMKFILESLGPQIKKVTELRGRGLGAWPGYIIDGFQIDVKNLRGVSRAAAVMEVINKTYEYFSKLRIEKV